MVKRNQCQDDASQATPFLSPHYPTTPEDSPVSKRAEPGNTNRPHTGEAVRLQPMKRATEKLNFSSEFLRLTGLYWSGALKWPERFWSNYMQVMVTPGSHPRCREELSRLGQDRRGWRGGNGRWAKRAKLFFDFTVNHVMFDMMFHGQGGSEDGLAEKG